MGNISLSDTPYCDSCHSFVSLIVLLAVKVHHISDGNEGKQSRNWILQSISRLAVLNIIMQVPADDTSSVFRPGLLFRDIYFEDQCNGLQTKDALFCCLSLVRPEILSSCISSFAEEVRRAEESGGQEYRKQFMLTGECDILQNTNPKIEVDFGVTMYPEMLVSLSLRRAEFLSGYYTSISPLKLRESVRFSEVTPTNSAFLSICQVELWTTFKGFENSIEMVLKRTGDGEMYSLDSSKIHELSSGIICMEGLHKRLCQASEKDLIWKKARDKRGNISEEDRRRVCRHICGSLQVLACAAAAASTLLGPLRLIIEELNSCNSLLSYSSFRAIFGPAVTNRAVLLYLDVCKELVQLIGSIFAHNLISEPSVFRVQGMIDFSQWSCSVLKDAVVSDPVGDAVSKFISWCIDVDDQEVFPCIFPSVRSSLAAFSVFVAESSVEGALLIITDVGCIIDTFAFFLSLNGDVTKSILGHLQWDSLFFPEALCLLDEFDRNRMSLSIPSPKESDASQPEFRSEMYRVYQENRFKFHLLLFSTVFDYLSAEHDISEDNNYLLDTAQTTMDIAKGVLRALTTEVSDSMEIASFCTFITRGQFVDGQYVFSNIVSKVNAAYCCANILRRWLIQTEAVIGMLAQKPLNSKQVQARNLLQLQELLTELQSMKTSAVKKWIEGARFSSNGWAPPEKAPWLERALSDPSLHTLRSQWLQCAVDIACFSADYSSSFPPDEMEVIEELPTIWKSLKKILRC